MDVLFGATFIKAAVASQQALFGTQMQNAMGLMTSMHTLDAGRQFLRVQEGQHIETMNRLAVAQQRQQAQLAENNYQQTYSRAMARHAEVLSHEQAHQTAAGAYGGGIHLEYQTMQVPMAGGGSRTVRFATAGHVPVHMPAMPNTRGANPATARAQLAAVAGAYSQVARAALAPHGPSGADVGVATGAHARLSQVNAAMAQLNFQPPQGNKAGASKNANVGSRLNVVG